MVYYINDGCTIVRKHGIILFFRKIKFLFWLSVAGILYYVSYAYRESLWDEVVYYVLFPLIFMFLNYAFLRLILSYIMYYYRLFIIHEDHIIIVKSSWFLIDDLEVIDIHKVMKIDSFSRWFLSNLFWYGSILIEQQKNDIRTFHFMPNPYRILDVFKKHKEEFKD
jgi:hypothetical protein